MRTIPWQDRAAVGLSEAAALLGVTRQHLYNLAGRGELRTSKCGQRVLVPVSEVKRLAGEDG